MTWQHEVQGGEKSHAQKRRWLICRRSIAISQVPIEASSIGPNLSPMRACARNNTPIEEMKVNLAAQPAISAPSSTMKCLCSMYSQL